MTALPCSYAKDRAAALLAPSPVILARYAPRFPALAPAIKSSDPENPSLTAFNLRASLSNTGLNVLPTLPNLLGLSCFIVAADTALPINGAKLIRAPAPAWYLFIGPVESSSSTSISPFVLNELYFNSPPYADQLSSS